MSNPIYELQALINGSTKTPSSGEVVSVGSSGVVVRTNKGTVVASNLPGQALKPGVRVSMQGNIITSVSAILKDTPIYRL